jgi:flagellar biosynthesis protein FlhG
MSRIITVTSGKGGVGKTNISVNLALYFADEGYRTCLFDADMGLANVDILLGLYPELSLEDVILEKKKISEIIIKDFMGIDIVPGSSGIQRMADPKSEELDLLINAMSGLENYDFLIIDTSAGISKNVVSFCMASSEIIVVVTPEPTSLTDAYSLLKILSLNGFTGPVMVAVNQCKTIEVSGLVFEKFKAAVEKYLPLKILPLGTILTDEHVSDAVKNQKPFISLFPDSNAAKGIKNIGRHLLKKDKTEFNDYGLKSFWSRCFKFLTDPLQLTASKTPRDKETQGTAPKQRHDPSQAAELVKEKSERQGTQVLRPQPNEQVLSNEPVKKELDQKEIPILLEKLTQGILTISSELSAIRGILEKGQMNPDQGRRMVQSKITDLKTGSLGLGR